MEDKRYRQLIPFDAESSVLTLRTDSTLTDHESEMILVRFQSKSQDDNGLINYSTYFNFKFSSQPYIKVSCGGPRRVAVNYLPSGDNRIWTFKKTTTFLEVKCDGVVIVNLQYSTLDNGNKEKWSFDSKNFLFGNWDNATDAYMTKTTPGNSKTQENILQFTTRLHICSKILQVILTQFTKLKRPMLSKT